MYCLPGLAKGTNMKKCLPVTLNYLLQLDGQGSFYSITDTWLSLPRVYGGPGIPVRPEFYGSNQFLFSCICRMCQHSSKVLLAPLCEDLTGGWTALPLAAFQLDRAHWLLGRQSGSSLPRPPAVRGSTWHITHCSVQGSPFCLLSDMYRGLTTNLKSSQLNQLY